MCVCVCVCVCERWWLVWEKFVMREGKCLAHKSVQTDVKVFVVFLWIFTSFIRFSPVHNFWDGKENPSSGIKLKHEILVHVRPQVLTDQVIQEDHMRDTTAKRLFNKEKAKVQNLTMTASQANVTVMFEVISCWETKTEQIFHRRDPHYCYFPAMSVLGFGFTGRDLKPDFSGFKTNEIMTGVL